MRRRPAADAGTPHHLAQPQGQWSSAAAVRRPAGANRNMRLAPVALAPRQRGFQHARFLHAQQIDQQRRDADVRSELSLLVISRSTGACSTIQHDALDGERACVEIERVDGKPEQLRAADAGRRAESRSRVASRDRLPPRRAGGHLVRREGLDVRGRRGVGAVASLAGFSAIIFHLRACSSAYARCDAVCIHGARRQRACASAAVRVSFAGDAAPAQQESVEAVQIGR